MGEKEAPKPLNRLLQERVRAVRIERGWLQEELALRARAWGLPWTAGTVAQLENGRRVVAVEEFVVLGRLLGVRLPELLEPDQPVGIGEGWFKWSVITEALAGRGDKDTGQLEDALQAAVERADKLAADLPDETWAHSGRVAERKAAAKFGVSVQELSIVAGRLWEGGLSAERDRRLEARVHFGTTARSRQAHRGRITRQLLEELRPHIEKEVRK